MNWVIHRPYLATWTIVIAALAGYSLVFTATAQATTFENPRCDSRIVWGRKECYGYFLNQKLDTSSAVFEDGIYVSNATDFIETYRKHLYGSDFKQSMGAAATIEIMLGRLGTEFTSREQGVARAKADFEDWKKLIKDYDKKDLIDWEIIYAPVGHYESTSLDTENIDIAARGWESDTMMVIRLRHPSGDINDAFLIDRSCANMKGTNILVTPPPGTPPPTTPPPTTPPTTTPPPATPPSTSNAPVSQPYFTVRGGDVSAGPGMSVGGVDCAIPRNDRAGVVSWNRGATSAYGGAGTQYAAFVLNHLQEFATAHGSPAAPSALAFANTAAGQIDVNAGLYGGKFAGGNCTIDYFAGAVGTQSGDRSLSSLPNFPAGGAIPNGARLNYYVDGDLFIDSNVAFRGTYANIGEIPSFSLVVKGNILVRADVAQLDGIYIAQPSSAASANGIIYTCATDNVPPFQAVGLNLGLHDACNTQLTVNGSLTARQVWLMRSFGSIDGAPAETVNYIPELWLSTQGAGGNFRSAGYDSITSLPPVL